MPSKVSIHPYFFSKRKRLFDVTLAALFSVLFLPLFLLISLIIFTTTGFPILFTQTRMGKNMRVFTIYKFRTMRPDAENRKTKLKRRNQAPFPMFKIENDPRYVGLGKMFSKLGIDELPQLINILKGDMSFVGPRPLPTSESTLLPTSWNFRYVVKPGLLSEWAISPKRHESLSTWKTLEEQTVAYGSITSDLKLLFRALSFLSGFKHFKLF